MKFELHCHSCYSKGSRIPSEGIPRPEEIIRHAKSIGLSGVAITDHGTTEAWKSASREAKRQGILFIPAVELHTMAGHLIALGISKPVENWLGFEESAERIHEAGGIAVAPHPFDMRGQGVRNLAYKADAVEIFNSMSIDIVSNRIASSRFRNAGIPKVAGSDAHTLEMLGRSVNIMEADDVDSVIRSILKGRVRFETGYIPMNDIIAWARERLSRSQEEVADYIDAHYTTPKAWLYRKMLKKFLATGNAPWRALAEMSLQAVRVYELAKTMNY
jgi:hypothetical protein